MYISQSTYGGNLEFRAHETAREAVAYLLDSLGDDYKDDFWVSTNGARIVYGARVVYGDDYEDDFARTVYGNNRGLDFDICVYPSASEAVNAQAGLDDYAAPYALRALADAVEAGVKAGF